MASTVNGVNGTPARRSTLVNGTTSEWQAKHNLAAHFIGGNRLEKAPPSKVKDFVQAHDGHSVITSVCRAVDKTCAGSAADTAFQVLIANNGIAAVKEIRSVRKWAYETFGDERAIQFTVMTTFVWLINMLRYEQTPPENEIGLLTDTSDLGAGRHE